MTVYILQEMGRNVRSAEKFGDLKVVLPDNRQIVLSSGPLTFKVLKWDRDEKRYYDIEIDLRGKRNE